MHCNEYLVARLQFVFKEIWGCDLSVLVTNTQKVSFVI